MNLDSFSSPALDSSDYPHISYYDGTNQDLKYASYNGTAWSSDNVDSSGNVGLYTSLALDSSDYPHISYYDSTNGDLKYASYNGTAWSTDNVDSTDDVGRFTSLVLDSSDYPHISYKDGTNDDVKYASYNGTDWSLETVDSTGNVGWYTSLALDSSNYPHISYYDISNVELEYASYNGTDWLFETVDSAGDVGESSSLALDSNDYPHISYVDNDNYDLKYAIYNGTDWSIETVDSTGSVGWYTSLALDSNNYAHISYYDDTNYDLKYATKYKVSLTTSTGTGTTSFRWGAGLFSHMTTIAEGSLPSAGKPTLTFTHGFFSFRIIELTPGQTVVVTITFPSAVPADTQYWKYHVPQGWVNVSSLLGDNDGDNVLTLTLTDGGLGDDDGTANGVIVDAGGPGVPSPAPPAPTPPVTGGGTADYYSLNTDIVGTKVSFLRSYIGKIMETGKVTSPDGMVAITIPKDTMAKDKNGKGLGSLNVSVDDNPPPAPEDNQIIGLTYSFKPDGATFDPPITLTFTYDPDDIPEGADEEDLVIAYWGSEWVVLEDSVVDPEANTITAPVSHFTAFTVMAYSTPASFTVSDLTISPAEVNVGETVTISATVTNTGDLVGDYEAILKIDGAVIATKKITLDGPASQKVTFTTSKDAAGTYTVNVNGQTGKFVVKGSPVVVKGLPAPAPPPPKPASVPPPTPPPAPVLPPTPEPVSINWWLVVGIVIIMVVVVPLIYRLVRRRRKA